MNYGVDNQPGQSQFDSMKVVSVSFLFCLGAIAAVAQTNNQPVTLALDPQSQALVNSLPAKWQTWGTMAVVLLMVLGRIGTSAMTSGGVVPILKSVFMGSVHTTDPVPTPTVVVPAPVPKPVPTPAAPTVVKSNP